MQLLVLCTIVSAALVAVQGGGSSEENSVTGKRSIQSVAHGTYLRAMYCNNEAIEAEDVDMAPHVKACEQWKIQKHGENVSLMPVYQNGKYLRIFTDGMGLSNWHHYVLWKPIKHRDGSWSLKSQCGKYLSAQSSGVVRSVNEIYDSEEKFWINEIDD